MSQPFLAEIKMFAGNFPIRGYAFCNGQILPISQNTALFSLLGVTYGGNGQTNFALPNLQGRAPMHKGQGPGLTNRDLGESDGQANVSLITTELPLHTHTVNASQGFDADNTSPVNNVPAYTRDGNVYASGNATGTFSPTTVNPAGGSQPHNNLQPFLAISFIIAMQGIFPARN